MNDKPHTKAALLDILKRIEALATNPHWTADRKARIAELAEMGAAIVEKEL